MKTDKSRRRRKHLLEESALAIYLSLNIEVIDDRRGKRLATLPLLSLTWLGLWIWQLYLALTDSRPKRPARYVKQSGGRRWHSTIVRATMAWIVGRSLVWGLTGV
jgi:hypothetical protein